VVRVSASALSAHAAGVERLLASYRSIPPTASIRLAKPTSNLFRARPKRDAPGLDTSGLTDVIDVDPEARTADVAGMCTYEDLVAATLRYGLAPLVVPQLKTITLGGAVTGLGIESTSFRNGLPHESVLEMDILTGAGELITVSPDQHSDLYRAFPNSYGTLGYSTRLRIELEPLLPFVALRHMRFNSLPAMIDAMDRIVDTGGVDGIRVDYLDGVVFSADESYLCVGVRTTTPGPVSDYTGRDIYYRSIQHDGAGEGCVKEDRLTINDYFWRWDTDWFWCSRPFGVQNSKLRPFWPRKYRRSNVYRKLVALDQKHGLTAALYANRRQPPREMVIQDVEIPVERGREFLEFFARSVRMTPVWLCPLRLRGDRVWTLYPMQPGEVYVNFGFWGAVPLPPGKTDGYYNRMVEEEVSALDGHKSLYSTAFYSEEEFRRRYSGDSYDKLKGEYDGAGRLLGLYDKCVRGR
jgi:FAD/FMN-containing dehydrogenase